jgi:hypothetical protein
MKKDKKKNTKGRHEYPLPGELGREQKQHNRDALQEAEQDMESDAEFTAHSPNDDLDEGELARLGENGPSI